MVNVRHDDEPARPHPAANGISLASGWLGVLGGSAGVWLGLSGDAVLGEARVELALAATITAIAFSSLLVLWTRPAGRWVAMGGAAIGYHLVLDTEWVPWIQHYRTLAAAGNDARVWTDAAALPLLMVAGIFFIVAALFAWQSNRSISTRRDDQGQTA